MFYLVKNVTRLDTLKSCHGKELAKLARECFTRNELLTLDFEGVKTVTPDFFRQLFYPMIAEFGAIFLRSKIRIIHVSPEIEATMQLAFDNLKINFDDYFHYANPISCNDVYDLNLSWLVKARELARDYSVQAQLIMGISDPEIKQLISQLSMDDIQTIAQSSCLCFSPRFTSDFIRSMTSGRYGLVDMLLALSKAD
jgi:hypothetical protein